VNSKTDKIYPDSGVELKPFWAKNYDKVMNIASLGLYRGFTQMNSNKEDQVRIAVPTNDGINIFPKMLGMAEYMFIYEIETCL